MLIAALVTIAEMWKQPKCPSDEWTDEWVKKRWRVHTVEFCSALKRRKLCNMLKTSYVSYLKESNSQNQRVECRLPGTVGRGKWGVTDQQAYTSVEMNKLYRSVQHHSHSHRYCIVYLEF